MVHQLDLHGGEGHGQAAGGGDVVIGGDGQAAGVVVGQNHGSGAVLQGHFYTAADGHAGIIDAALPHLPAGQELQLGVQTQQEHRLVALALEKMGQIFTAVVDGIEDNLLALAQGITPLDLPHQLQEGGAVVGDAIHLRQLEDGCIQHSGKTAEAVHQGVGDWVGVPAGDHIEKQQLQHLDIGKTVQPLPEEPVFQPLAVAFVNRHIVTPQCFPCYFYHSSLK